jgi:hypothetical protein
MATEDRCEGKCTAPPNKGVRQTYWCGFTKRRTPQDHEEHDHKFKGQWYHCYG